MTEPGEPWWPVAADYLGGALFLEGDQSLGLVVHLVPQSVLVFVQGGDGPVQGGHLLLVLGAVLTQLACRTRAGIKRSSGTGVKTTGRPRSVGRRLTYSPFQLLDLLVGSVQLVHLHREPVLGVGQRQLHLLLQQPAKSYQHQTRHPHPTIMTF